MDVYRNLNFNYGSISYSGIIRSVDGGVPAFCIKINNKPPFYGGWQPVFIDDNNFYITIRSIGYVDKFNIGNNYSGARLVFSDEEMCKIRKLIKNLFDNLKSDKSDPPFNIPGVNFIDKIDYL